MNKLHLGQQGIRAVKPLPCAVKLGLAVSKLSLGLGQLAGCETQTVLGLGNAVHGRFIIIHLVGVFGLGVVDLLLAVRELLFAVGDLLFGILELLLAVGDLLLGIRELLFTVGDLLLALFELLLTVRELLLGILELLFAV